MFSLKNISLVVGFFPKESCEHYKYHQMFSVFLPLFFPLLPLCFPLPLPCLFLTMLLKRRIEELIHAFPRQRREKLYKEKVKLAVKGKSNHSRFILESD